jgi:hypothetical protein
MQILQDCENISRDEEENNPIPIKIYTEVGEEGFNPVEIDYSLNEDLNDIGIKISSALSYSQVNSTPQACTLSLGMNGGPYQKSLEFLVHELAISQDIIHKLETLLINQKYSTENNLVQTQTNVENNCGNAPNYDDEFSKLDTDNDGKITRAQFLEFISQNINQPINYSSNLEILVFICILSAL